MAHPASMRAARLHGPRNMPVETIPVPVPGDRGIVIRVMACGVSRSDSLLFEHGQTAMEEPRILGQRIAGEVVATGSSVIKFDVGDRVAVGSDIPGRRQIVSKVKIPDVPESLRLIGVHVDGGFAEYLVLDGFTTEYGPVSKLPKGLSFELATLAEPVGRAIHSLRTARMAPGKQLAIIGANATGLIAALVAQKHFEARQVVLIEVSDIRKKIALNLGFDRIIDGRHDVTSELLDLTDGHGADCVVVTAASPEIHEQSLNMVAHGGMVSFVTRLRDSARTLNIRSNLLYDREIAVAGSQGASLEEFKAAIELIRKEPAVWEPFLTATYPLDRIQLALDHSVQPESLQVIILPQSSTS